MSSLVDQIRPTQLSWIPPGRHEMESFSQGAISHGACHIALGDLRLGQGRKGSGINLCLAGFFWKRVGLAPAPLALAQQPLDQGAIRFWRASVAPPGVPMMAFFVVALWMGQAEVQEIAGAAQAARADMLNCRVVVGSRVEAQAPATDQAFADPEAISIAERGIGGGNLIFLARRHNFLLIGPLYSAGRGSDGCGFPGFLPGTPGKDHRR